MSLEEAEVSLWPAMYDNSFELDRIQMYWSIVGEEIEVAVAADTTSYVAIGFRPEVDANGNVACGGTHFGDLARESFFLRR